MAEQIAMLTPEQSFHCETSSLLIKNENTENSTFLDSARKIRKRPSDFPEITYNAISQITPTRIAHM